MKRLFGIFAMLLLGVAPGSGQDNTINDVRLQQYERFWRVAIFVTEKPVYKIDDRAEDGKLFIDLQAKASQDFQMPEQSGITLERESKAGHTVLMIGFPVTFKFDAFYFAPGKKLIIDCYPSNQLIPAKDAYTLGLAMLQNSDTLHALQKLDEILKNDPQHTGANLQAGIIRYFRREYPQATENLLIAKADTQLVKVAQPYLDSITVTTRKAAMDSDQLATQPEVVTNEAQKDTTVQASAVAKTPKPETKKAPARIIVASSKRKEEWLPMIVSWIDGIPPTILIAAVGLVLVASLYFGLRAGLRMTRKQRQRKKQYQRIVQMLEKNAVYKSQSSERAIGSKTATPPGPQVDVFDSDSALMTLRESAARRNLHRAVRQKAGGASGNLLTEQALKSRFSAMTTTANDLQDHSIYSRGLKKRIVEMAITGKTLKEIAQELNLGVGEVELVLGFGKTDPELTRKDGNDLRIDFAF